MKQFSQEIFDKFIDGTADQEERFVVREAMRKDKNLRRIYIIAKRYDAMTEADERKAQILPMERMAAETLDNLCDILCERYIMRDIFPGYVDSLLSAAKDEQIFLQKAGEEGVPLYKVGFVMDKYGLVVQRQYHANLRDVERYLKRGERLIAVVDEDILKGTQLDNMLHTVCVLNVTDDKVRIYNPTSNENEDMDRHEEYPKELFLKAWEASERYLVRASTEENKVYEPHPINLEDIEIGEDLLDLIEPIAENLHDVWAEDKLMQGIRYAPLDNNGHEKPGHNHYLVPFSQMTEEEKQPDIKSARQTLKLLKRLGFSIARNGSPNSYVCPDCGRGIALEMSFCPHCGRRLQVDDFIQNNDNQQIER